MVFGRTLKTVPDPLRGLPNSTANLHPLSVLANLAAPLPNLLRHLGLLLLPITLHKILRLLHRVLRSPNAPQIVPNRPDRPTILRVVLVPP